MGVCFAGVSAVLFVFSAILLSGERVDSMGGFYLKFLDGTNFVGNKIEQPFYG